MKKLKLTLTILLSILSVFLFNNTLSAQTNTTSEIETQIIEEVQNYVDQGILEDWHLEMIDMNGYHAFYFKQVHLSNNIQKFSTYTKQEIFNYCLWYRETQDETWDYILENLDIEPQYLEPNKYLGLYWDSLWKENQDIGYLYLIWTSHYTPSEFVTILQFKESGKTYNLYDSEEDMENLNANWYMSEYYHFKEYNLTIHLTPIGGIEHTKAFGIPLKQKYSFEGFTYGMDQAQYFTDMDPNNQFNGTTQDKMTFDLGLTPKLDGKNSMQLVTHAYEIIKECEVQSTFDLNFGGYKHYVSFNTTIPIDKIYRVDVSYKITNDNRNWWQFYLPTNEHTITKSLTSERVKGGIFNLSSYQGFTEGSFQSTKKDSINYNYRLHLNYDAEAWNIFKGYDHNEEDYKRVSQFQILRMNYIVDNQTFDVPIKMDTIEGETLSILDSDLILDTEKPYYNVKNWLDDTITTIKDKTSQTKPALLAVLSITAVILIIWALSYVYKIIKFILIFNPKDKNKK